MSDNTKGLNPNNPIVKWLIATAVPCILLGLKSAWDKWVAPVFKRIFGIDLPFPEAAVNELINIILWLILDAEKQFKEPPNPTPELLSNLNVRKFDHVVANLYNVATPLQMEIIKQKWGSVQKAVQNVYLTKAKPIIESKKAQNK
jgi:hypothetical protein